MLNKWLLWHLLLRYAAIVEKRYAIQKLNGADLTTSLANVLNK